MKLGAVLALALGTLICGAEATRAAGPEGIPAGLGNIETIVVIYAENRSFDNLYGSFPGANGLPGLTPAQLQQLDRDGTVLKELPPVWDGLTAKGVVPPVTQAMTEHLPNMPFAIDDPKGFNTPLSVINARFVAPLLPEPDADRWRQERQIRRLCRFGRAGHGPL